MKLFKRSSLFTSISKWVTIGVPVLMLLLTISTTVVKAQTKDTTHWNDEDLYTDDPVKAAYFGVGGGFIGGLFFANFDVLNTNIARPFVGQDAKSTIFMTGGQGFVTLPWVKNLRVGGMGSSGTSTCDCNDTSVQGNQVNRELKYTVGYGALTIDYVLPLGYKHFSIVPGIALGAGSVQLYAQQAANRASAFDINDEFSNGSNITHNYHSSFFFYMPQLQFEYSFKGFAMLRATVAYQGTSMGTWSVDDGVSLGSTDKLTGINGSGLSVSLGVFFGLFP